MSRKNIFTPRPGAKFAATNNSEQLDQAPVGRPLASAVERLSAVAAPVGSLGRVLTAARERSQRVDEMERALRDAPAIVELNPEDIDPSFARDRMTGFSHDLDEGFLESIRTNGQQVPILVRPHPTESGRYQTAYGHRRIAAARALGRPVRAVVKALSDDELVVAQGQENIERNGLSFIEKCRFAHALEARSFTRETIARALSAHKTILSIMISLIERLPPDIIEAIGPAPATGRRAWSLLADRLDAPGSIDRARAIVKDPRFIAAANRSSDQRFQALLGAMAAKPLPPEKQIWAKRGGRSFASLAVSDKKIILSVERSRYPELADLILSRLSALKAELEHPEMQPQEER